MNVYEECPVLKNELVTLRQTRPKDAEELLNCYSDKKAVPFFNSDNCHGDDFYYATVQRMEQALNFWDYSYKEKYFVRWTVIDNASQKLIGTVEMFHRLENDDFNHYGILRIDLQSTYEKREYIERILDIADQYFYNAFDVSDIITKSVSEAVERIVALKSKGYKPLGKKFLVYDNYFIKSIKS